MLLTKNDRIPDGKCILICTYSKNFNNFLSLFSIQDVMAPPLFTMKPRLNELEKLSVEEHILMGINDEDQPDRR